MLLADNHFTPIVGIDIHFTTLPPFNPFQPFIGVVMDPMDYIPFIGATVNINGSKRGVSDTSGVLATLFHIPIVGPFAAAPIIGHESMNFFASETVKADGTRLSPKGYMVMSCNDVGIPLSIQPGKKKFTKLVPTIFAPTSYSLPIPTGKPVIVGAPYGPDMMGMVMGLAMSFGFGAIMRYAGKLLNKLAKKIGNGSNKMSKWLCKLGFEPINLVTGAVVYDGLDFELPSPIPFAWERTWDSDSDYVGILGHGVHCKYDRAVQIFPEEEAVGLRFDDGRMLAFPLLDLGESYYMRQEKTTLTRTLKGHFVAYSHTEELHYYFEHKTVKEEQTLYKLTKIEDLRGFKTQFIFKHHQLTQIIDASNRELTLEYTIEGFVSNIYLNKNAGKELLVAYQYDALGNMIGIADALEQQTIMEYQDHLMIKKVDRNGQAFYWEYEGEGTAAKCIHTWGDNGWQEGWMEYHTDEGYNKITDANGVVTYYYYTPEGLVTEIKNGEGDSEFTEYTEFMEVYRDIDQEGNVTGYTYDEQGNQTSVVYPNGAASQYMYNEEGRLVITIDPEGNKRNYTYKKEAPHLVNSIVEPDNSMTVFTYNNKQLVSEVKNNDQKSNLKYDKQYNLETFTDQDGNITSWAYNRRGQVLNITANGHIQQNFGYDNLGRVIRVENIGQEETQLKYNAYNEVLQAFNNKTKVDFEYTPMGSLKMRQENGTKVFFSYDKMEQLKSIKNEHNETYSFKRNKNGEIIIETGFDALQRTYRRDRAGKVIKVERPNNQFTEYEYNALGQITRTEYSDGTWETFSYNKNGQLIAARNQNSAVSLERDNVGRIVTEKQSTGLPNEKGYTMQSAYNANGNRIALTSSLGANIQHKYNSQGQCVNTQAESEGNAYTAQKKYNPLGQEIERVVTGGITSSRGYDWKGRQNSHEVHGKKQRYRSTRYTWNPNHQLEQIFDVTSRTNTQFTYDAFGCLASAQYVDNSYDYKLPDEVGNLYKNKEKDELKYGKGGQLLQDKNWQYLYDSEGNLIKKTKNNTVQILADFKKEQKENPPTKNTWFDRVLGYTDEAAQPNLKPDTPLTHWKYGEWFYTWQANGMLKQVKDPKGKTTVFEYDALGRRTAKINIGKKEINRYIYDGNVLLHEFAYAISERPKTIADDVGRLSFDKEEPTTNLITWVFDEGTFVPSAKITSEGTFSIISDYLGTPILSFDEKGNKVWERELDIYGNVRKGDNHFIPFLYQGQYYDEETGLAYNRFRYYNPETGGYISQDPIGLLGNNPNLYAYSEDINKITDPFGLSGIVSFIDSAGTSLDVSGYTDLSHLSDKQLTSLYHANSNSGWGLSPKDAQGNTIVLHHYKQNPQGPIVAMPAQHHDKPHTNPGQHPFGKKKGGGLSDAERKAFGNWRKEYHANLAETELNKRGIKCK
ncbi:RHS repeat-associated core domain-containing protein [Tenacibaculum ovolyticum]|uniref:RHS repeat-associated core domain-containing protein n=1 Tax=Tenacibaculum ovolyticum TaxID=104270 RepID=UPI003BAD6537